ncbi:MAG: DNA mismatch repair endonuclease MutL, partial [Candidatus Omnitrophota bacterium]
MHILPPEIVSKIAAGEVIERPASVVKELIENALDAGAKSVELSLNQAGKVKIIVRDKGTGIEPEDIEKIFFRHSTSKIKDINDLYSIRSLGFRGEALYSIVAVADVVLRSKAKSNDTGWEIHLRGGQRLSLKPISMLEGTEVEIGELFFNTPARRKFLKPDTAELHQILNTFIPYSLLYPDCRFSLTHNDKILLDLPAQQNYISRIARVLNLNPEYILKAQEEHAGKYISIRVLLGDINIQRGSKDLQFIFVNNRPVRNYNISYHLNQVYKHIFPAGVYPFFALYIIMPTEDVDVNVHPTKREVKIVNEDALVSFLQTVCEQALLSYGKAKQMERIMPS